MTTTKKREYTDQDWKSMEDNYAADIMVDICMAEYRQTGDRKLLHEAKRYQDSIK